MVLRALYYPLCCSKGHGRRLHLPLQSNHKVSHLRS